MSEGVFVTGMARSGTTLLGKLLGGLDDTIAFSQPLPLLLVDVMRAYLFAAKINDDRIDYPLTDEQFGHAIDHADFAHFLDSYALSTDTVAGALERMATYSGQYFKPVMPMASLESWPGGNLADFARHYFAVHGTGFGRFAWKETLSEIFVPHLLEYGFKVALIVRDPRDVIASLDDRASEAFAGSPRPLLWAVRHWRKSVAYFHELADDERVLGLRYEDLVTDPAYTIDRIACWLGADPPADVPMSDLLDGWRGNSTRGPISGIAPGLVGRYRAFLSVDKCQLVEALCAPEMAALGYFTANPPASSPSLIARSVSPGVSQSRPELSYFEFGPDRREEEIGRWKALMAEDADLAAASFIFRRNHAALRRAVRA